MLVRWAVLLVLPVLVGCQGIDALGTKRLDADISEVLLQTGSGVSATNCEWVGRTRTGYCIFDASADEVDTVVRGLAMRQVRRTGADIRRLEADEGGCHAYQPYTQPTRLFRSMQRDPNLILTDGSSFEYLLIYERSDLERVCVQVLYAYG